MGFQWRRPENIPFPSIWHEFKAKDTESDELVTYRIQDLPENRNQDAIDHMVKYYLNDEPTSRSTEFSKNPLAIKEIIDVWNALLKQKLVIVCFKEGSDEIVGVNLLAISQKIEEDIPYEPKCEEWKRVYWAVNYVFSQCDIFEKYKIDKYMTALGLSVDPKYRGRKIGLELLKARKAVCQACGIKLTSTIFTAITSQTLAEKCGFVLDAEVTYEELAKKGHIFTGITTKSVKSMSWSFE